MDHPRIIFFDFDGVIVNTYRMSLEIHQEQNATLQDADFQKFFEGNVNQTMEMERRNHPGLSILNFFKKYRRGIFKHPLVPGIAEVVQTLSNQANLIIVSSTQSEVISEYLEHKNLRKYFLEILGNDVHPSKVYKFNLMLGVHQINPSDCVYITDTLGDIREAKEAGMDAIAVSWGYHPKETLESGSPYAIVADPRRLVSVVEKYFLA